MYAGSDRFTSTATLVFTMPESPVGAKTTDVTLYAKFSSLERAVTLQFLYYKAISGRAVATITPTSILKSETGGNSHTPLSLEPLDSSLVLTDPRRMNAEVWTMSAVFFLT